MRSREFSGRLVSAAAFLALFVVAGEARAECGALPKVDWWGNLNHDKIVSYVNRKHDGDWAPYIKKWERQLEKIQDIHKRGSSAVIKRKKKKKVTLKEESLQEYAEKIEQRVEVTKCLAQTEGLANFSTAAGGKDAEKPKEK